jgi:putative ABC transport system permease protein
VELATVGVGVMIGSFRQTVVRWLASTLQSDVYVSPPSLVGNRPDATLDPALIARLASVPGVARVNTNRTVRVESPTGPLTLVALDVDDRVLRGFSFVRGDPSSIAPALAAGGVLVSEPLAYHRRLDVGARLRLRTDRGDREFPVVGIVRDYGSTEGAAMLSRRTYEALWDDRAISALGLVARPGTDGDALLAALRGAAGPDQDVLIRSNRALREGSLEVFDRTFAVTVVLRFLATVVAFAGVLSALMALGFERARELAMLRAHGFTPGQVWGLVVGQSGLMGVAAGLFAIPVGLVLALLLVFVINQRSFGWTLQLEVPPGVLLQAVGLAMAAALVASLAPAHRIARQPLPEALRDE